jgi:hypothetical protein
VPRALRLLPCLALAALVLACSGDGDSDESADTLPTPTPEGTVHPGFATARPAPRQNTDQETVQAAFRALGLPVTFTSADLPEGWPEDLPAYQGATVVGSVEPAPVGASQAAVFRSEDSFEAVLGWFESALAGAGLEASRSSGGVGSGSILFASEDANGAVIALQVDDGSVFLIRYSEMQAAPGY